MAIHTGCVLGQFQMLSTSSINIARLTSASSGGYSVEGKTAFVFENLEQ